MEHRCSGAGGGEQDGDADIAHAHDHAHAAVDAAVAATDQNCSEHDGEEEGQGPSSRSQGYWAQASRRWIQIYMKR